MSRVQLRESRQRSGVIGLVGVTVVGARQRAPHQNLGAVANPFAHPIGARCRHTQLGERLVDAEGDIRQRVHEGAIEIDEHQGWNRPGRVHAADPRAMAFRMAPMVAR
jgi:hypothetical protein